MCKSILRRFPRQGLLGLVALPVLFSGCASLDWDMLRLHQTQSFQQQLEEQGVAKIPEGEALDLDRCIAIALENNLAIQSAELEARIAKLDRRIAFASFLPEVKLQHAEIDFDKQVSNTMFSVLSTPVSDKRFRETVVSTQIPVFVPATWFLYALRQRGEAIGELVLDYTRQMIALQVTALYYQALILDETSPALEAQIRAAAMLQSELRSYEEEGLITTWQADQGDLLLLSRKLDLSNSQRARKNAGAELLSAMGLSPLAPLSLAAVTPLEAPEEDLEALVLEAMLNHPRLQIADQSVEIQKDLVKIAITQFLPVIGGLVEYTDTGNSFVTYPQNTMFALTGVMTLFNGFANINEYKKAKAEKEQAFRRREEECLTLMVEVLRAKQQVDESRQARAVAAKALAVAEGQYSEVKSQAEEGLVLPSALLDVTAGRDHAYANLQQVRFWEQISLASLANLTGATYMGLQQDETEKDTINE